MLDLIDELKILSNLNMHLNLVNLLGACTSQLSRFLRDAHSVFWIRINGLLDQDPYSEYSSRYFKPVLRSRSRWGRHF